MPNRALREARPTEQAIREAAIQLISKIGFDSMSLRQLATQAGVNPGTLYLYYQGKRSCWSAWCWATSTNCYGHGECPSP
ncbi:TetR/AcrR family transcriptional regulator [Pseudomonas lalucatii]|nr:TetR/AcrR family transcriptional regulator [Pseudomonas lalucatii]QVM86934.1 TetR/AcrR family transcriptional regulator [Pseudomonas lalucatii]